MAYNESGIRLLFAAVAAQAAYDYRAAVKAGVIDRRGNVRQGAIKTAYKADQSAGQGGKLNVRIAADMSIKDIYSLGRQVRSNDWVTDMRKITGMPVNDAREFRSKSLNQGFRDNLRRFGRMGGRWINGAGS